MKFDLAKGEAALRAQVTEMCQQDSPLGLSALHEAVCHAVIAHSCHRQQAELDAAMKRCEREVEAAYLVFHSDKDCDLDGPIASMIDRVRNFISLAAGDSKLS